MRHSKFVIIIAILFFFSNCEKDVEILPREYPYVITKSPTVTGNGAVFSADLSNLGDQEILEYGFVWSTVSNPTIQDYSKTFDDKANKGIYSFEVSSGLAEGQIYYVRAYVLTDQYEVYGNEKSFISNGSLAPVIHSFDPKYGPIGTKIVIEGENFALSKKENLVKFGSIQMMVDSVSENLLVVSIPQISRSETVQVSVETAGMLATAQDSFDLWFPWKWIGAYHIDINHSTSFSYKDKGYIIMRNSDILIEFNPRNNVYSPLGKLPENSSAYPLAAQTGSKSIVLLGNNVYELDLESLKWNLVTSYPKSRTDTDYLFYINDEIFVGSSSSKSLIKYDYLNRQWITITEFSESFLALYGYSSTDNYGYLYTEDNSIYRFTPSDNSWILLTYSYYSSFQNSCQFLINNTIYIGLGKSNAWADGYANNQICGYNIEENNWTEYYNCPKRMHIGLSLTIDGKGYAFSTNGEYYKSLYEVWEYDPAKK